MGVSARPIACTNVLCFGPPDPADRDLPPGVLHPRRVRDGVVAGIGDYGNKLGLPTVNGAVVYDEGYLANPLVYCGALGLLPSGSHPTEPRAGDRSSPSEDEPAGTVSTAPPSPRQGWTKPPPSRRELPCNRRPESPRRVVSEVVEQARDLRLYNAITDCGAGGFSSAVGEMGEHLGAEVDLAGAPLKYAGLEPWEIWLSEAQERMVLAVPGSRVEPYGSCASTMKWR